MKTKEQITTELGFDKIMYFDQIDSCHEAMEEYANQLTKEETKVVPLSLWDKLKNILNIIITAWTWVLLITVNFVLWSIIIFGGSISIKINWESLTQLLN